MLKNTIQIGIIGGGNMGQALLGGLLQSQYPHTKIILSDPTPEKCQSLTKKWQVNTTTDNLECIQSAEILLLAVKPQQIQVVLNEIKDTIKSNCLICSVAAGITTTQMSHWLNLPQHPIIRAMPNTPALIGQGITALFKNEFVQPEQAQIAQELIQSVGQTAWLEDESLMDVVTGLSGSGPAYFFYILEGLAKAGEELGLSHELANQFCLQTALGSILMAIQTKQPLAQLREQVTSKGGTTEKGLQVLGSNNLFNILKETVQAATNRGKELSELMD